MPNRTGRSDGNVQESPLLVASRVSNAIVTAAAAVRRHPRRLAAAVLTVLGGTAVTAFGIAPLAPDAAALPQHVVTEEVAVRALARQIDELAQYTLELARSDLSRASDTADTLLRRLGIDDPVAAAFIRSDPSAHLLIEGRGGKMLQARSSGNGSLIELVARYPAADSSQALTHFTRLTIARVDGRFASRVETVPLQTQVRMGGGTIRSTLFGATDEARLPDAMASQLVEIFSGDIDFHRQLRKGDTFSVVYEGLTADGQPITWNDGAGRVLAAEFVNNGKTYQAIWFKDASGKGGYFGFDGKSRHSAFLASPMAFSRITSTFAMRMHPILNSWRAHNGVDYGAPTGTPVRTVGDGVVASAGWQTGYGNVIAINHGNDRSTVYAHLSKIEVRRGQRVEQGQRIGLVGATGWATGPHLHFEFRVHDRFQDPLKIARTADPVSVDPMSRPRFEQYALTARSELGAAEALVGYRGDAE